MDVPHPFDEAVATVKALAPAVRSESVPVDDCLGRILATEAVARIDVPPFDRAMMDGFALRVDGELEEGITFSVTGTLAAGDAPTGSPPAGSAVRIMTGAPMPADTNAVARFEWCEESTSSQHGTTAASASVRLLRSVRAGESVQPRGQDGGAGTVVLGHGVRLAGAHLSLLRTYGIAHLSVAKRPTCSIIVTGSELCRDTEALLAPGQIYGANDAYLSGALTTDGIAVTECSYVEDSRDAIRTALVKAVASSDFVILTGGVSAGDYDYVPRVIADLGGQIAVRRVLMRPGSPLVAATVEGAVVFALSGNPAAGFVQFETLVRPVLRQAMGWHDEPFPASGRLLHTVKQKPVRHTRILRGAARIEGGVVVVDTEMAQAAGQISSFASANCLVRLDEPHVEAGTVLPLRFLDGALSSR
ncbi:molybdopterin molybdotransferase MoeA [Alicyclobacillus sp. ALC3]|uniref:molybdopterin molybdotransferase MoeA n=1 Tax=Alicyclobacillus sp. ALC3 TaxID=2796143 RepID=UPI00237960F6|nr:molybdopterin molybdotransferase MoeA [Alicyclobacillus sp. ALC3]WDL96251.1 molybdopterin molybdotransferase MoeA [Alicyclobacillus sp. ALC3]